MRQKADERPRVLVVDDDRRVLASIEAVLDEHVSVHCTSQPTEALRLLDSDSSGFHVVCADYCMPRMNGVELLERVAQRPAYVSCLLITGADEYFAKHDRSGYYVLLKPFSPDRLVALVLQLARVAHMKRTVGDLKSRPLTPPRAIKS
ncbi:MAG: response regulator [Polyangiales bacterium]